MPSIQDRIKKQPPFIEEEEKPVEEKQEEITEKNSVAQGRVKTPEEQVEVPEEQIKTPEEQAEVPEEQAKVLQKEEGKEQQEEKIKQRTKEQFEKIKETNKRLKEEVKKYQDVLSSLHPQVSPEAQQPNQFSPYFEPILTNQPPTPEQYPHLTQKQINETFKNLVDDQGYVDIELLKSELAKREEREQYLMQKVVELEQKVGTTKQSIEDYQRTEEMRKVHQKYPQIDPESPQFDERMWEAVRNEIIGQWTTQGKEDVEAACEKWLNILYPNMGKDKQAEQKTQINALSPQPKSTAGEWEEHEALVEATRKGKKGALAERLKRAGY